MNRGLAAWGTNPRLDWLISQMLIPGYNGGALTVTSDATVNPGTGAAVGANTAQGKDVLIGSQRFPGAALLAQRGSSSIFGAASVSSQLASNTTAAGDYPTVRTLIESTVNNVHGAATASVLLTDGVNYGVSTYVRLNPGSASRCMFIVLQQSSNYAGVSINLSTGATATINNGTASVVRSSARQLANGWWFLQATVTATAWGGNCLINQSMALTVGSVAAYTGDGISGIQIAGYKCELGENATTPHNWDGGVVSRQANLLSWAQALSTTAMTIIALCMPYGRSAGSGSGTPRLYDAASNARAYYNVGSQLYSCERTDSFPASNAVNSPSAPAVAGQQKIIVQRFDATSNRITVDGVTVSSAAPTMPLAAATPTIIGNRAGADASFDGHVALICLFSIASDADVALIVNNTYIV